MNTTRYRPVRYFQYNLQTRPDDFLSRTSDTKDDIYNISIQTQFIGETRFLRHRRSCKFHTPILAHIHDLFFLQHFTHYYFLHHRTCHSYVIMLLLCTPSTVTGGHAGIAKRTCRSIAAIYAVGTSVA